MKHKKFYAKLVAVMLLVCLLAPSMAVNADEPIATPKVVCGGSHTVALKANGTVWAWGRNNFGQLGDGTTTDSHIPVQVPGLSDIVSVAAGHYSSYALDADGNVWAWGYNHYGQLGDGTQTDTSTPIQTLTGVITISAGEYFAAALKEDGTVWTWGNNQDAQLGDGTKTTRPTPGQVEINDVISIICAQEVCLVIKNDGTVWGWGGNGYGIIGNDSSLLSYTPEQMYNMSDATAIDTCSYSIHSLVLKSDGTVWGCGGGYGGPLGSSGGTTNDRPIQVCDMTNIVGIAAGSQHSLLLTDDGHIWSCGINNSGQLGIGTNSDKRTPTEALNMNDVIAIEAGSGYSAAIRSDGSVWMTGGNSHGRFGDGTTTSTNVFVEVGFNVYSENPPTPTPPDAPANLTATAGDAQIGLSWDTVSGADSYTVMRAEVSGGPYTAIATGVTETTYTDTDVTNGITYYYVVVAVNGDGDSEYSNEASATPAASTSTPDAPTNLTATAGDTQVTLSWDAVSGADSYTVMRATVSGGPYTEIATGVTGTSYTDTDVTNGTTYYYIVVAVNGDGDSEYSNEASATPMASTPAYDALLRITMVTGEIKEYQMDGAQIEEFVSWCASEGAGSPVYEIVKDYNLGPFSVRTEYIVYDKMVSFEVLQY